MGCLVMSSSYAARDEALAMGNSFQSHEARRTRNAFFFVFFPRLGRGTMCLIV